VNGGSQSRKQLSAEQIDLFLRPSSEDRINPVLDVGW
jgi:hypothetical protein